ncbi:MAG: acetylxylan esterase [Armatimonadetes bacterium]|nr:acetylxylan esterase [Armatimonadota bacterium]
MSILLAALSLFPGQTAQLKAVPFHASGLYHVGEKVGWKLTGLAPGQYSCVIRRNNKIELAESVRSGNAGSFEISWPADEPSMIYAEVTPPGGGKPVALGAAIEPTRITPSEARPKDFKQFWDAKIAALRRVPENAHVTEKPTDQQDITYGTVVMDHVGGEHVYGQLARPKAPGKHPALLQLQWASPPYPLDKWWVMGYAKQGFIALNIEPHDVPTDAPASFYQGLPNSIKNYNAIGQGDRDKNYFVNMYLRGVRALDYLAKDPDWDGKTLVVIGTSMGGQQSLCLAGLHPKVTHLIVNVPAGCDINADLHGRQGGYPNFNVKDPKVAATAPYVDAVNFAPDIKATCLVAMGFIDTVSPPCGIWAAFNQIKGPKEVAPMPESPHNHLATPAQLKPYTDRSAVWLTALGKSQPVVVQGVKY